MSITKLANEIVLKLKNNQLTRGDLTTYFNYCKTNLQETRNIEKVDDAKNVATPFLLMLAKPDFTNNNYLWQTVCAKAHYTSSYYLQTKILDDFNIPRPEKLIEYVELLKVRLMILLNGKTHFPDLVFRVPENPNNKNWSPFLSSGTSDRNGFESMVMSDAGLISKYASFPSIGAFQQENLNFANSVLSDNSNLLINSTKEDLISNGLNMHKLLFTFLDNNLHTNGKLDFHSDEDDD